MKDDNIIHTPVEGIVVEKVGNEALVLDTARGKIHQLNSTAAYIWSLLDGVRSDHDIAQMVSSEFDIDLETASKDVRTTLQVLTELEVLKATGR